jgi:hypothetical protein
MPSKITVHPVYSSKKEAEIVKLCKYHFIDRLNFSGVQYDAISFVSAVLNEAIKRLDTKQSTVVELSDTCKPKSFDISTIEKHAHEFLHHLRERQISLMLFEYIQNLVSSAIEALDKCLNHSIKS